MSSLHVTYLFNSGFVVKSGRNLLIFDYYLNPVPGLEQMIADSENVWVFSSHRHADHYNPEIIRWQDRVNAYILSDDIRYETGIDKLKSEKIIFMPPYQEKVNGSLRVVTYGSTDEGVSFYVELDGWRIFHAGDLNWWHWKGDTAENIRIAEEAFRGEMSRLANLKLDIAFFPVDSRLEEYRAIGAEVFCQTVEVPELIAMHTRGEVWTPPAAFPGRQRAVTVWCPAEPGENRIFTR